MQSPYKSLLLAVMLFVMAHGISVTSLMAAAHSGGGGDGYNTQAALTATATAASASKSASPSALKDSLGNLDKTVAKSRPSSAVEDWSLVCQQLCGAALGGAECTPYCKNMPVLPQIVQLENANTLLDAKNLQFMCPQLCGLHFGDDVCTCKNWLNGNYDAKMEITHDDETNVCAIFCDFKHVTLTGCSPCDKSETTDQTPQITLDKVEAMGKSIIMGFDEETTPDWNELCASLCKTGDGGSLCNCDLSPFYV
ncbi:uncharacterized protein LOC106084442 [Stomoxys calcitrans]|uniref:uncharacterized protein LOC106084442 n=1 Tax=Stomoxys calcitrans TaxID=35570 RepID=UPI0027E2EF17|nr:uncharacterized protein LOC106084442 [Stomoxys calcitrans]